MATTFLLPRNNIKTTLSTAINSSTTSIEVVNGSIFPNSFSGRKVLITVCDDPDPALSANFEFMLVTARTGNTLTVERGAYGTSPLAFEALDAVRVFITKEYFDEVHTSINAIEAKTDFITVTQNVNLDTIESDVLSAKTKTDWLTVTQAVNLDTVESDINLVKQAYIVEGQLRNGYPTATVSGGNLTVSIKTIAGTDPSPSNPVKIMIDGVDRSITSALSVTANAGTNWGNAGGALTSGLSCDYFIYIIYNTAQSRVDIAFSRKYGDKIGDFTSFNSTDFSTLITTISVGSTTDTTNIVGIFSAILSAGGTYTWSSITRLIQGVRRSTQLMQCRFDNSIISWAGGTAPTMTDNTGVYKIDQFEILFSGWYYSSGGTKTATSFQFDLPSPIKTISTIRYTMQSINDNSGTRQEAWVRRVSGSTVVGACSMTTGASYELYVTGNLPI